MSYVDLRRWLVASLLGLGGCGRTADRVRPDTEAVAPKPIDPPPTRPAVPPPPVRPTMTTVVLNPGSLRPLLEELGPERLTLVLKLNRVDQAHLRAGDSLVVPADSTLTELALAPFPARVPALDSSSKFLVVSQRIQAFAAYELGHLVYWGPTSTGKTATPTPNGLFHTNWKAKETRSTDNNEWLLKWYFNFDNRRGVSFHQFDLPGRPASHACVRLLAQDAEWIYRWADQWTVTADGRHVVSKGTPVLVFGDYAFGRPGPWRRAEPDSTGLVGEGELVSSLTRFRDSTR